MKSELDAATKLLEEHVTNGLGTDKMQRHRRNPDCNVGPAGQSCTSCRTVVFLDELKRTPACIDLNELLDEVNRFTKNACVSWMGIIAGTYAGLAGEDGAIKLLERVAAERRKKVADGG
jgi:hypothetical protein